MSARDTVGTIAVRNEAQRVLLEGELKGQISDGLWENARPHDHWERVCDAEVVVDPDWPGLDFRARKTNYDFTSRLLLEVVGDRMVELVRREADPAYDRRRLVADLRDLKAVFRLRRPAPERA